MFFGFLLGLFVMWFIMDCRRYDVLLEARLRLIRESPEEVGQWLQGKLDVA